jgi:hypothetical protein
MANSCILFTVLLLAASLVHDEPHAPESTAISGDGQFYPGAIIRLFLVFGEPLKTMDRSDTLLQKESAGGSKECRPLHFLPYQKDWK